MKIGIDARELLPGVRTGIGRYLRNFLEATVPAHPETEFVLIGNQRTEFGEPAANVTFERVDETRTAVWDQRALPRAAARHEVDVLFSPYDKGPVCARCPVVITIHDLTPLLEPGQAALKQRAYRTAYRWSRRLYARRAAAIITDSAHSKEDIVSFFGLDPDKVTPVPIGLPAAYKPAAEQTIRAASQQYQLTKPYILYVGNFKPHKNVQSLITAYRSLPDTWKGRIDLALCGGRDQHRDALESEIEGAGLSSSIRFLGFVPDEDMPGLYGGAVMLNFPSLYEGFGLPPLEAMACGAPVVCSNATSLPEVVGDAGILVDAKRPDEIRDAMLRVLEDDALRADLIRRGTERAAGYSPEATAEQVYHILAKSAQGRT